MNEYTASNGVKVEVNTDGPLPVIVNGVGLRSKEFDSLREFFRAERDEELGRWRWPENPEYVVYPMHGTGKACRAVSEETGSSFFTWRTGFVTEPGERSLYGAARAYFDAHPEPKPWHDAKPGEVWEIVLHGQFLPPEAYSLIDGKFRPVTLRQFWLNPTDDKIKTARRVYPESD